FRDRAQRVLELLSEPTTAFVLVTSPRQDAVEEAMYFASKLHESGISVQGLVVNRLFPRYGKVPEIVVDGGALVPFVTNLRDLEGIAEREEADFAVLAERVAAAPVARVPFLADDVHDVGGLDEVASFLLAG